MLTRREVIIEKPFRDRRYKDHRRKVRSALPRIDAGPPPEYPHLVLKLKKLRMETDRQGKICQDNIKLVHRMAIIMRTKRLDNINTAPRGPFEPKRMARPRPPPSRSTTEDQDEGSLGQGSFLEQVTAEVDKHLKPLPPCKTIKHRAPAGACRVPRVGPAPSPSSPKPRRRPRVPTISLPHTRPRFRDGSPSPEATERSSSHFRRGREPTRLSPLPRRGRRPSISSPIFDENSSSAADDGDSEEDEEEGGSGGEGETKKGGSRSGSRSGSSKRSSPGGGGGGGNDDPGTDSDDHVSSILLQNNPNITIDEASEDDFYQQ